MTKHQSINLNDQVSTLSKTWSPIHLLTLDNSHSLKLAKIQGEFIWHSHPNTDELFLCVSGPGFKMELNTTASSPAEAEKLGADQVVVLKPGEIFSVPREMQHRPVAGDEEVGILMVEKVGTLNTGDVEGSERTVVVDEKVNGA